MSSPDARREDRQYDLMAERLQGFRTGEIGIAQVIADLEGLLTALELAPDDWTVEFLQEWSVLEIAHAVALDRQAPLPTASSPTVAAALHGLDRLLMARRAPG